MLAVWHSHQLLYFKIQRELKLEQLQEERGKNKTGTRDESIQACRRKKKTVGYMLESGLLSPSGRKLVCWQIEKKTKLFFF